MRSRCARKKSQEEPLRRTEHAANTAVRAAPAATSQNELGSGVETGGGGTGIFATKGGTPGPRIGGKTGEPGAFGEVVGPIAAKGTTGRTAPGLPGKISLPSPGSNCANNGGTNVGSLNSSVV